MNLRSFKQLKSLAVLLLSLEFLTPAILTGFFPYEQSNQSHLHILPAGSQKNPALFLVEETDREEVLREDQDQNTTTPVMRPVVATYNGWVDKFNLPVVRVAGKHFDNRPPLFTLHCLLLL